MYHMFSRILTYETGIMIGCSNYDGVPLAERLSGLTAQDIESASEENNRPLKKETVYQNTVDALPCSWSHS